MHTEAKLNCSVSLSSVCVCVCVCVCLSVCLCLSSLSLSLSHTHTHTHAHWNLTSKSECPTVLCHFGEYTKGLVQVQMPDSPNTWGDPVANKKFVQILVLFIFWQFDNWLTCTCVTSVVVATWSSLCWHRIYLLWWECARFSALWRTLPFAWFGHNNVWTINPFKSLWAYMLFVGNLVQMNYLSNTWLNEGNRMKYLRKVPLLFANIFSDVTTMCY